MIVQRSEHEISSLNKGDALFCAGEAAVGSDFSLFRHSMCSRQILSLHKLMSRLLTVFPHHFFFSYCLLCEIKPFVFSHKCLMQYIDKICHQVNAIINLSQNFLGRAGGFFFPLAQETKLIRRILLSEPAKHWELKVLTWKV